MDLILVPVVLIFFFFLIIIFWRRIWIILQIAWLSIFYGRYSFEFLDFFKTRNIRSPHNTCIKDEITVHFLVFYRKLRNFREIKTPYELTFSDTPAFSTYKEVRKLKGTPDCMNIARFPEARVVLIGYRELLQDIRVKRLYYFIHDRFIMGEIQFNESLRQDSAPLLKHIARLYLDGAPLEDATVYIIDPKGNQLLYENNGFSLSVKILFHGNPVIDNLLTATFAKKPAGEADYGKTLRDEGQLNRF